MPDPDNQPLEHTEGGPTTRTGDDLGVPMTPATEPQTVGPEDAAGAEPTRGDYSDRTTTTWTIELIPEAEREPGGPTVRRVRQGPSA